MCCPENKSVLLRRSRPNVINVYTRSRYTFVTLLFTRGKSTKRRKTCRIKIPLFPEISVLHIIFRDEIQAFNLLALKINKRSVRFSLKNFH